MTGGRLHLPVAAIATCLGVGKSATVSRLFEGTRAGFVQKNGSYVGALAQELPTLPERFAALDSRNNRLLAVLADEIRPDIERLISRYGRNRIAIVIGTSTSGIAEGEAAVAYRRAHGRWPSGYAYAQQETGSGAAFLAQWLGLSGPAYVVATACSSSAKTFASARRLIACGLADAALVGGADTLCGLTQAGFGALGAVSAKPCNPFSTNRDGITIGEGGALFLLDREEAEIALLGVGETSDAHHVSAPDPEGRGAEAAMRQALADASLKPRDISFINLHGTATPLNDAMESKAVSRLFDPATPAASTKAMTGHTLGAAGAVEAALAWLALSTDWNPESRLVPHLWDGVADPAIPVLGLSKPGERFGGSGRAAAISNSFAFGGNNCAVVLGRGW